MSSAAGHGFTIRMYRQREHEPAKPGCASRSPTHGISAGSSLARPTQREADMLVSDLTQTPGGMVCKPAPSGGGTPAPG
jgi:hypothetical protein